MEGAIDQARGVDEGDEWEAALLARGDLCLEPVVDGGRELCELVLEVGKELHRGLAFERVALLAGGAKGEALSLDRDGGALHMLADVPAATRAPQEIAPRE